MRFSFIYLLLVFAIFSCKNGNENTSDSQQIQEKMNANPLLGKWRGTDQDGLGAFVMLGENGKAVFYDGDVTYTNTENTITITEQGQTLVLNYTLNGDHLELSNTENDIKLSLQRDVSAAVAPGNTPPENGNTEGGSNGYIGTWTGKSGRLVIRENGTLQLGGAEMNYKLEGNVMHLENKTNKSDVELNLEGNQLSVTGVNGSGQRVTEVFSKGESNKEAGGTTQIAGSWMQMSTTSTNSGAISYQNVLTLNPDGTFQYGSEGSMDYSGSSGAGGVSHTASNSGTWNYDGTNLYLNGNAMRCEKGYYKNDPALIINGTYYATRIQRAGW